MREAVWLRWSRPLHVLPLLSGILALAAAMGIGRFAYTPLLPAMQEAAGLDSTQAGLLAATNYAGYLAGALLAAVAVPASARVRILLVSAITVAATTALMAATANLAAWSAVRFVAGLASAGVLVLATGLVLDDLRRQGRTSLSGWLFSGVGLGIVVSGVVVRLTGETLGWRGDWLLLALLATVAIYPFWRWLPRAGRERVPPSTSPPASTRPALRRDAVPIAYRLLFAAYFLEGIGYIVTGTFLVAIVDSTPGLQGIGADVWIVVGLAVIPSAVLWGTLAGRAGYARALTGAYVLQAIGIALPIAGGAGAAFASAVLFGGTFAGITALTLTLGGHLETNRSARLIGMLTAVFSLGQMIGPVLGGVIAHRAQNFAPALVGAAISVLAGGVLMALLQPFDPLRPGSGTSSGGNRSTRPMPVGHTRWAWAMTTPDPKRMEPMELDQASKKKVFRDFTYGLYAVTAAHDGERGVFTANWLSQASFEPPLVMLSVENDSSTLPLIRGSGRFAICPLDESQKALAGALGRPKARSGDKYATLDLAVVDTESGVPALADSLGYLVCDVRHEAPAGDSVVFIGEVVEARSFSDAPPLEMRAAGFRHAG